MSGIVMVGLNWLAQVMSGVIVYPGFEHVQWPAAQLWPSSWALRSVAHEKLLLKSDCTTPKPMLLHTASNQAMPMVFPSTDFPVKSWATSRCTLPWLTSHSARKS